MVIEYRMVNAVFETFMGVVQRTGAGSKPRISRVVSKSDSDHGSGYYGHRNLGLTPAVTICCSTRSLGLYPILYIVWQPSNDIFGFVCPKRFIATTVIGC